MGIHPFSDQNLLSAIELFIISFHLFCFTHVQSRFVENRTHFTLFWSYLYILYWNKGRLRTLSSGSRFATASWDGAHLFKFYREYESLNQGPDGWKRKTRRIGQPPPKLAISPRKWTAFMRWIIEYSIHLISITMTRCLASAKAYWPS